MENFQSFVLYELFIKIFLYHSQKILKLFLLGEKKKLIKDFLPCFSHLPHPMPFSSKPYLHPFRIASLILPFGASAEKQFGVRQISSMLETSAQFPPSQAQIWKRSTFHPGENNFCNRKIQNWTLLQITYKRDELLVNHSIYLVFKAPYYWSIAKCLSFSKPKFILLNTKDKIL